jgi:hypothetical protein
MRAWTHSSALAFTVVALAACGKDDSGATPLPDAAPRADAASLADAVSVADAPPPPITGADPRSVYLELGSDTTVMSSARTLLTTTIDLAEDNWVLVSSDGRFFGSGAAEIRIAIDGATVSNRSTIDWNGSLDPVQHSFNAVGAQRLAAGNHTVALVATPTGGEFTVGSGSNLSVMVRPAARVTVTRLAETTATFDFDTRNTQEGDPAPHQILLHDSFSVPGDVAASGPLVALASGGSIRAGHDGDAMLALYLDGADPGNGQQLWSVNDTCQCAEQHAPLYSHAFLRNLADGAHTLTLEALELPWAQTPPVDDPALFEMDDNSTLITLSGGLTVAGSYFTDNVVNRRLDYFPMATSEGWPDTPPVGTDVKLAEAQFDVPAGHTGVILFATKTRVQGDASDPGGVVSLWLELDGARVGSTGLQQLATPFSVSQRTLCASYLAAGTHALTAGQHTIRAYARADGKFIHLVLPRDLPLIFFD